MGPSGPAAVASCFGPIKEFHEMPEQSDGISLSPQRKEANPIRIGPGKTLPNL